MGKKNYKKMEEKSGQHTHFIFNGMMKCNFQSFQTL